MTEKVSYLEDEIKVTFKSIIKALFIILVIVCILRGYIYEGSSTRAVEEQDNLFVMNLMTYNTNPSKEIYIYKAADGMGVMLVKYNSFMGWKAQFIDKLYYREGENWRYIEIEDNNDIIPVIFGFFKRNLNETFAVRVENKFDNLDDQAKAFFGHDFQVSWYMLLNRPSQNSDAFRIYDLETEKSFY